MSFTATFTQAASNTALNAQLITDTSVYGDEPKSTFTDRRVYLYKIDNTLVKPPSGADYWDFNYDDYPEDEITIAALTEDFALNVVLVCVSEDPQTGSTYTALKVCKFDDYSQQFKYSLVERLAGKRSLETDQQFKVYLILLHSQLLSCAKATFYQDQYAAQKCLDNAKYIITNQSNFF